MFLQFPSSWMEYSLLWRAFFITFVCRLDNFAAFSYGQRDKRDGCRQECDNASGYCYGGRQFVRRWWWRLGTSNCRQRRTATCRSGAGCGCHLKFSLQLILRNTHQISRARLPLRRIVNAWPSNMHCIFVKLPTHTLVVPRDGLAGRINSARHHTIVQWFRFHAIRGYALAGKGTLVGFQHNTTHPAIPSWRFVIGL